MRCFHCLQAWLFFVFLDKLHDIPDITTKEDTQLIDSMRGDVFAMLDCVISGLGETHFEQTV